MHVCMQKSKNHMNYCCLRKPSIIFKASTHMRRQKRKIKRENSEKKEEEKKNNVGEKKSA